MDIDRTQLNDNEVYVYKNGKLQILEKPKSGFGKTIVHWQNGKPLRVEVNYTEEIK